MNTSRRIFRGRAGPTDGRLPKHSARRRRPHQPHQPRTNAPDGQIVVEHTEIIEVVPKMQLEDSSQQHSEQKVEEEVEEVSGADVIESNANNSPSLKEMKHLQKRVKNVQESIQTSVSITNPTTYEQNVLNAVTNCINEWRAIAIHYNNEDLDPEQKKNTALAVYMLIQYSLQCGPLEGANPGYFKRCGSQVAKVVLEFLEGIVSDSDVALEKMGFTPKQVEAMEKWKSDAQKAVEADKAPSKSALKKQQGKMAPKKNKKVKG
jgi:hypothetical protein